MSEEAQTTTTEPSQPTEKELGARLNTLEEANRRLIETNDRLLKESKSHAEKWRTFRDAASADETTKLEEEKNWKALLEKERGEKNTLSEKMETLRRRTLKKTLDFEVARYASDANDVTDIINSLPSELISIDEENYLIDGVSDAVAKLREVKPYLFKRVTMPETVTAKPGYTANAPEKTIDDLTMDEKLNAFKDVLSDKYGA